MEQRYTRTAILLHWLVGLLLLAQFVFGWQLDDIPRNTPARGLAINWHKSAGILLGLLIVWRLVWRLRHAPPALPAAMRDWQQRLARLSHGAMYVCMIVMPLSGYLASNFSKHGIKLFNAVRLAPWGSDDKAIYALFNQTHKLAAWLLVALIVLHVLAVLKHALIDRDGILARMGLRKAPDVS